MKCPHCQVSVHESFESKVVFFSSRKAPNAYTSYKWQVKSMVCPSCTNDIITLVNGTGLSSSWDNIIAKDEKIIHPLGSSRNRPSHNVPEIFKNDYLEASAVIHISEKASAALSRRCLQNLIHNHLGIKEKDLNAEIKAIRDRGALPTEVADQLDHLREIGNFAAHPKKDAMTGEIIDVDTGEAEWSLNILDEIFDYCFDRPARIAQKKLDWESKKTKVKSAK